MYVPCIMFIMSMGFIIGFIMGFMFMFIIGFIIMPGLEGIIPIIGLAALLNSGMAFNWSMAPAMAKLMHWMPTCMPLAGPLISTLHGVTSWCTCTWQPHFPWIWVITEPFLPITLPTTDLSTSTVYTHTNVNDISKYKRNRYLNEFSGA